MFFLEKLWEKVKKLKETKLLLKQKEEETILCQNQTFILEVFSQKIYEQQN